MESTRNAEHSRQVWINAEEQLGTGACSGAPRPAVESVLLFAVTSASSRLVKGSMSFEVELYTVLHESDVLSDAERTSDPDVLFAGDNHALNTLPIFE